MPSDLGKHNMYRQKSFLPALEQTVVTLKSVESVAAMVDRRPEPEEPTRAKRQKTSSASDYDPSHNPYLAHLYPEQQNGHATNGDSSDPLAMFKRHRTDARLAKTAEDGPLNPFNSTPLSKQYLNILTGRRKLPVHAQRCVFFCIELVRIQVLMLCEGTNS